MNFPGDHRGRPSRARGRARQRPGLELLEGRRLLAASPLATTLDGAGNPVDFAIQVGGSVVVDQERATNNPAIPYRYSGFQSLPGLAATSIAGVTLPDGDPAVVATTGPQSYLYLNTYAATGVPATPFAWTGWQQFGTFVASSVAAASDGTSGSAIFAVGADTQVYEAPYDPSTTATTAATAWSGFQKLAGPGAASISVLADGPAAYEVTALGGPQSYVEANKVSVTAGTIGPTGWSQLGTFVASSINLTPGVNTNALGGSLGDRLFLFAVGADGSVYNDPLTLDADTGARDSTTYTSFGSPSLGASDGPAGRVVSSTTIVSDAYMTIFALTDSGGIYENQVVATGLTSSPLQSLGWQPVVNVPSPATAMAATPTADGGADLLAIDDSATVDINHLSAHAAVSFPGYDPLYNNFSGWSFLVGQSSHPIAADTGPGGLPIVVALGSDGSVYDSIATAAGASGAPDTYSAFAKLAGLTATSIAATREANGFAAFALVGPQSFIYEDQYLPTGNPSTPYAWTGWVPMGTFVATSIAAASPADATSDAQATVFGRGVDGIVAASGATAAGGDASTAAFTPLGGLAVASFSVKAEASAILVAGMTGPESYAYADPYTPSATANTPGQPGGWTVTGTFVLNEAAAGTDSAGNPVVGGVTAAGARATAVSLSIDGSTAPTSTPSNYQSIAYQGFYSDTVLGFASVSLPNSTAVGYLKVINGINYNTYTQLPANQGDIYLEPVIAGTTSNAGSSPINANAVIVSNLGVSTGSFGGFYVAGTDGTIYASKVTATGDPTNPLKASTYASLGDLPS